MNIAPFALEQWQSLYSKQAKFNLADTCTDCMSLEQLLSIGGASLEEQLSSLMELKLNYGEIQGSQLLRQLVAQRYKGVKEDGIIMMNGAAAANALVMYSLLQRGDHIITFHPSYPQFYFFPASLGIRVTHIPLDAANNFLPNLADLRRAAKPGTKMILLNNPNNPTGTLLNSSMLEEIVWIARNCGSYILSDEICLSLWPREQSGPVPSIADLYERGIATSSLSKALSLAALRIGWIACADQEIIRECMKHRDYTTVSCGTLTDRLASMALNQYEFILVQSRQLLRSNLSVIEKWAAKEKAFSFFSPQGGTSSLLKLHFLEPSETFCRQLLEETGVLLVPGTFFGLEGYVRIGCAVKTEVLQQGLARISKYVQKKERRTVM